MPMGTERSAVSGWPWAVGRWEFGNLKMITMKTGAIGQSDPSAPPSADRRDDGFDVKKKERRGMQGGSLFQRKVGCRAALVLSFNMNRHPEPTKEAKDLLK